MKKIHVEIWSDVVCPFCYIGKRRFELALEKFAHKDAVEIEWKSFQLDPNTLSHPGMDVYDYLAERYGRDREWSIGTHQNVTEQAAQVGLEYNFDKAVIAPTFDAHQASHFAKSKGRGSAFEELLFRSYFTDGKDLADHAVLADLGASVGLDREELLQSLANGTFEAEVQRDIHEAKQIGVQGVPFFVFNRKYAVSGAQDPLVFRETLETVWKEL
ncbi:MAG: oxidoreductase [Crocinitomicaceae bacterium]|jgi:protein disulfide-isomerase|nr:oxidoreductase [Crocinitomicaceae bacterium]